MSTKIQAEKNIKLSAKLADFLVSHPDVSKKLPDNASFVTFSAKDKNLNDVNTELIQELLKEGKNVVKAQETSNDKQPWKFSSVSA